MAKIEIKMKRYVNPGIILLKENLFLSELKISEVVGGFFVCVILTGIQNDNVQTHMHQCK